MARTLDSQGYWLAASDGEIYPFGDAVSVGSLPSSGVKVANVVALEATVDHEGYWLTGSDGRVYPFGDAGSYGSLAGVNLSRPIVSMAPTADARGYWLVASDGAVFSFGDAQYYGAVPGRASVTNIVGMWTTAGGKGYWIAGSDGAIYPFGDASLLGSPAAAGPRPSNVVGMAPTMSGKGYWSAAANGSMWNFGDAADYGGLPGGSGVTNIVGILTDRQAATSLQAAPALVRLHPVQVSAMTLLAVLRVQSSGQGLNGQYLRFRAGTTTLCDGVQTADVNGTDGTAICGNLTAVQQLAVVSNGGYDVDFAAAPSYLSSTAWAPLVG